ncbi:MAG: NAD(P)H-hydrate epimerase [Alphaproteobacteria bacterium]
MPNNRVLTIQQIIESENNFINQNSQEKIFEIAGRKLANFFFKNYKEKEILFICGTGNNGVDGLKASYFLEKKKKSNCCFYSKKKNIDL